MGTREGWKGKGTGWKGTGCGSVCMLAGDYVWLQSSVGERSAHQHASQIETLLDISFARASPWTSFFGGVLVHTGQAVRGPAVRLVVMSMVVACVQELKERRGAEVGGGAPHQGVSCPWW